MKIAFGEITRGISRYTIPGERWLPSITAKVTEPVTASITLQATGEQTVSLVGQLNGSFRLDCARCGDSVEYALSEDFFYQLTTRKEEISELQEYECSDEECDTLYLEEPVIDVAEILQEQFYLSFPGKVICSDDCRGLCPECGGSLNKNECSCKELLPDSPFAVLKKLKKD